MCSVLFYFCLQCVILGEVKPLTMHRQEAADLFPTPRSHMAQHGCAVPGTGATPYTQDETISSSTRGLRLPSEVAVLSLGGMQGLSCMSSPITPFSRHFLLRDSQLCGSVTHDELSSVEMPTVILALRTVS